MASNHVVGRSESNQRQLELNQWNVSNSMKHWWDLGYEARNSPRPDQISLRPKPFSRKKLFKPKRKTAASSPDIESHFKEGKHSQRRLGLTRRLSTVTASAADKNRWPHIPIRRQTTTTTSRMPPENTSLLNLILGAAQIITLAVSGILSMKRYKKYGQKDNFSKTVIISRQQSHI